MVLALLLDDKFVTSRGNSIDFPKMQIPGRKRFHAVAFEYNWSVPEGEVGYASCVDGWFSLEPDSVVLNVGNDLSLSEKDLDCIHEFMHHLEYDGLPRGDALPEYLLKTQGRHFDDLFYNDLRRGLQLNPCSQLPLRSGFSRFRVANPMGLFKEYLILRGYECTDYEKDAMLGPVPMWTRESMGEIPS